MNKNPVELSIIILNYNTKQITLEAIESIEAIKKAQEEAKRRAEAAQRDPKSSVR